MCTSLGTPSLVSRSDWKDSWTPCGLGTQSRPLTMAALICWQLTAWGKSFCFFSPRKYILLLFKSFLLLKYSCLHFLPSTPPNPSHLHLPHSILPPFGFVHVSFIHVLWWSFPLSPSLSPPTSLLVTVRLLLISMSLVIFCLLVCFVD